MKRGGTEKFHSIRLKFFLIFVLLLSSAVTGIFVFTVRSFKAAYYRQVNSHMEDISALSTTNVSNRLEQIDQFSVSVLINPEVQENLDRINRISSGTSPEAPGSNLESCKSEISKQIRGSVFNIDGIISMRIYGQNGDEIFVGTTNREYLEYSVTPEEIYAAGGSAIWNIAGDNHYACMCRAILDTKDLSALGYMVIVCKNDYFRKELMTFSDIPAGRLYLLDDKGSIVSADEERLIGSRFPKTIEELESLEKKTIRDPSTGEESYYYTGSRLKNGWTLVSLVTTRYFADGIRAAIRKTAFVLAIVLLLSLGLILAAVHQLLGPTQQLLKNISAFGKGKLDARVDIKEHDEIGQIGRAYNHMADNIQNLMEKVYELELTNKEAEIEFLKMQINPHFLYNSLDTISWLGYADGNEKVSDLAVSLANLLRATIKRDDFIEVRNEMNIVRDYLNVQSYRFGDRISFTCLVPDEVMDYVMPAFLLQPLIENSIIHGLEAQEGKGNLNLVIQKDEKWLYFQVSDDGKGMSQEQVEELMAQCRLSDSRQAIGLKNVYRRLQLLYGEQCLFKMKSGPDAGTEISFRIPLTRDKKVYRKRTDMEDIDEKAAELSVE